MRREKQFFNTFPSKVGYRIYRNTTFIEYFNTIRSDFFSKIEKPLEIEKKNDFKDIYFSSFILVKI